MTFRPPYSLLLCFIGLYACSTGSHPKKQPLPNTGELHRQTGCASNSQLTYSLYLPTGTKSDDKRPVMLFFDPNGDGSLPLVQYMSLAEKYGFILVGSENAKNGTGAEALLEIIRGMMEEIRENLPLDTQLIYTAGFSGGARVAALAAMHHTEVRGVTGCGAGFPGGDQPPNYRFDYLGLAGTGDLNLTEMTELDRALEQMGMRHLLITFPGKHAWPPHELMEQAFLWHRFNAMRDGLISKDPAQLKRFSDSIANTIVQSGNDPLQRSLLLGEAISFLEGLEPVESFRSQLRELTESKEYLRAVELEKARFSEEMQLQQELMGKLFSEQPEWWRKRMEAMDIRIRGGKGADTMMPIRLKAYISLLCYSNAQAAMKQNSHELANNIVDIYRIVDPSNPEPYYLKAILLSWAGDSASCFRELQMAVDKGFNDRARMMQQPEFEDYKESPSFFDLTKKMR